MFSLHHAKTFLFIASRVGMMKFPGDIPLFSLIAFNNMLICLASNRLVMITVEI